MITTKKTISVRFDKEDLKRLEQLCRHWEQTPSSAIKNCIRTIYSVTEWEKVEDNVKKE